MLKYILLFGIVISASLNSSAQKKDIDSRLIDRLGAPEAEKIYHNRPDYYNFLMFELTEGYEVLERSEVNKSIIKNKSIYKALKNEDDFKDFDFKSYGVDHKLNQSTFIKLRGKKVLRVKSKVEIKNAFLETGLQNSKQHAY